MSLVTTVCEDGGMSMRTLELQCNIPQDIDYGNEEFVINRYIERAESATARSIYLSWSIIHDVAKESERIGISKQSINGCSKTNYVELV